MRCNLHKYTDRRVIKTFAIFPIIIHREMRWLETCYIEQNYCYDPPCWIDCRFITKEEYLLGRIKK